MAAVARGAGTDSIDCTDGAKGTPCLFDSGGNPIMWMWDVPTVQKTKACSSTVFVNGIGVIRNGDIMASHPDGTICTSNPVDHSPALSSFSATVFADGKNVGRLGDKYDSDGHCDHTVSSGSPSVFAG